MKVIFVMGGIPHYYASFLNKLQSKGVDVTIVTPKSKSSLTIGKGVKINESEFSFKFIYLDERLAFYKKAHYPHLATILENEKPEIVVLGYPYFIQYLFDRKLRKIIKNLDVKFIIREIPFQVPIFGKAKKYYCKNPIYNEERQLQSKGLFFYIRAIMLMYIRRYCYSKCVATLNYSTIAYDILPSYGVPKEAIFVTYNATDNESLWLEKENVKNSRPVLPPNNNRILHIGRLVKWKRVDLLINAFSKVLEKYPNAELLVIGDGPELENLKQQTIDLCIVDDVLFMGGIYDPYTLGQYMNESSVYVLAGMGGLSINDAMAYGLPVICSVCDGTEKDLVKNGYNGLFFKENKADSLAEKIIQLLDSPDLRKRMGTNSENIIKNKINMETVSQRYIEAFKFALQK